MAISAKIQLGSGGVSGYNEWEVVYNASTQPTYKTYVGLEVGQPEPAIIWHTPDNAAPVPVSATNQNKLFRLTMDVTGANWDTIINSLAPLKRALHGANSQALRSFMTGDANRVRIALKPDGATYTTYYNVIAGTVDDSMAYYTAEAVNNTLARQVVFMLTCEPFGYGDSFTLKNALPSSPHMILDSNGDGLADGLVLSGTPTTTILTTNYLTGGKTQQITTAASGGEGVTTANISAAQGSTAVAYAWILHSTSAGDKVTVRLTDGSGNIIQSKDLLYADSTGVSDRTAYDNTGARYFRVVVSGTNSAAANFRFDVVRTSANATTATTFLIDSMYLQVGTTTAPPAFSGSYTLTNNANNYLDFWGIPGDMPALVRYTLGGLTYKSIVLGKKSDGTQLATKVRYIIQNTYFANGGTWATTSNYTRASADASVSDPYTATDSGDDGVATAKAIGETIWKVYVVARASALDNGLYAQWSSDLATYTDTSTATPTAINTWELWDLGILNPIGQVVKSDPLDSASYSTFGIRLVSVIPSSGTVDIDYLLLIPISEEYMVAENTPDTIMGDLRAVFNRKAATTPAYSSTWRGSMWSIYSGNKMTRILYHDYKTSLTANAVTAGDTMTITTTVIPRTSHLLGTK